MPTPTPDPDASDAREPERAAEGLPQAAWAPALILATALCTAALAALSAALSSG